MKRILKYRLVFDSNGVCDVTMPYDAEVLSVQLQNRDIVVWVIADDAVGYPTASKRFAMLMTGEPCYGWGKDEHLVTLQIGDIVAHVFMEK